MTPIEQTDLFLRAAGFYFLATVDGDQPRVRPFGTHLIFEEKLYIQMGYQKDVSKQIQKNPKVAICAKNEGEWIRITGTLVDDPRREPKAAILDKFPDLKALYSPDDENTQVLYFKPGTVTATIWSFTQAPIELKF